MSTKAILTNVTVTNPQNNDLLVYNSAAGSWFNQSATGSTGATGSVYINSTPSINLSTNPITYNGTIDIGNQIFTGNKLTTPISKQGIIDNSVYYANNYSGYSATDNAIICQGGQNTIGGCQNSLLNGFNTNFSASNSVFCNANFSTVSGSNVSIGCIEQSNIGGGSHSMYAGWYLGMNNLNNSIVSGFHPSLNSNNSDSCFMVGQSNQIQYGVGTSILGGNNNRFTGDTGFGSRSCMLMGTSLQLVGSLPHTYVDWIGTNIIGRSGVTYQNQTMITGGESFSGTTSFSNGTSVVAPPVGYETESLCLFGNKMCIGVETGNHVQFLDSTPQCSVVPVNGNDLVNKTYCDSLISGVTGGVSYSTATHVQQIDGPWFNNFTMHIELLSPTIATLSWRDIFYPCTLNSVFYGFSNPLPVQYRPATDKVFHVRVQDDGNVNVSGSFRIKTDGYIVIGVNRTDTVTNHVAMEQGFNTPGIETTCGIHAGCITYSTVY